VEHYNWWRTNKLKCLRQRESMAKNKKKSLNTKRFAKRIAKRILKRTKSTRVAARKYRRDLESYIGIPTSELDQTEAREKQDDPEGEETQAPMEHESELMSTLPRDISEDTGGIASARGGRRAREDDQRSKVASNL